MVRARSVWRVLVGVQPQWGECGARLFEVADAGHHVDYRFGGQAGNRGRSDVVDTALEPGCEHILQQRLLGFKPQWPIRIVRSNGHGPAIVLHWRRILVLRPTRWIGLSPADASRVLKYGRLLAVPADGSG